MMTIETLSIFEIWSKFVPLISITKSCWAVAAAPDTADWEKTVTDVTLTAGGGGACGLATRVNIENKDRTQHERMKMRKAGSMYIPLVPVVYIRE
jgi:ribosomal protein L3